MDKLSQLATVTNGKLYFPNEIDQLIESLIQNTNYKAIQKSNTTRLPIIEWYWLLILISVFLAMEWFIRKYNGLL